MIDEEKKMTGGEAQERVGKRGKTKDTRKLYENNMLHETERHRMYGR